MNPSALRILHRSAASGISVIEYVTRIRNAVAEFRALGRSPLIETAAESLGVGAESYADDMQMHLDQWDKYMRETMIQTRLLLLQSLRREGLDVLWEMP